jgi:hypothetical protein
MKFLFTFLITLSFVFANSFAVFAAENHQFNDDIVMLQDEEQVEEEKEDWESDSYEVMKDPLKYYKERYEKNYDMFFEDVFQAVVSSIKDDLNCMIITQSTKNNDDGFLKGVIKSDFCVKAVGNDTTLPVMKRYSLDFPVIRGGVWVNGRVQYKFVLNEKEDGTTSLLMKVELSGREDFVTGQVQFWQSNGILEKEMFDRIDEKLGIEPDDSEG